jgi:hypothetical protein
MPDVASHWYRGEEDREKERWRMCEQWQRRQNYHVEESLCSQNEVFEIMPHSWKRKFQIFAQTSYMSSNTCAIPILVQQSWVKVPPNNRSKRKTIVQFEPQLSVLADPLSPSTPSLDNLFRRTRWTSCLVTIGTSLDLYANWCVTAITLWRWLASAPPPREQKPEEPYTRPNEEGSLLSLLGWLLHPDFVSESNWTAAYGKASPTAQTHQSLITLATNHDSSSAQDAFQPNWALSGSGRVAGCTQCRDGAQSPCKIEWNTTGLWIVLRSLELNKIKIEKHQRNCFHNFKLMK